MKSYFFFSAFCLLIENHAAFSINSSYAELASPAIKFSRVASTQLFGGGRIGILNCPALLSKQWAYPNGQVVSFCNEAETSCMRYGLIYQQMKLPGADLPTLKQNFSAAYQDAELKLRGCVLAIEATITNSQSVGEAGGFPSY